MNPVESTAVADTAPRTAMWKWGVCWLMFLATMLNYMDRQALGNTSPFVMREFDLNEEGYGRVEKYFGYAYAVSQICAGFLVDRFSVRWLYAGAVFAWSLAGFFTGFVPDVGWLLGCRVMLGVCESVNWPAAVRTTHRILPARDRTQGNGIFNSGGAAGAVLTPLLVSWLVPREAPEQWRFVFQLIGVLGAFWVVAWLLLTRGPKGTVIERGDPAYAEEHRASDPENGSFWSLFLDRRIWIVLVVSIAVNLCWHFYRVWLPRYLDLERHFDKFTTMQYAVAAYYIAADLGSLGAGKLTKLLSMRPGMSVARARWIVMVICAMLTSLSALAVLVPSDWMFMTVVMLVAVGNLGQFAGFFAFSQDVSPRHTALVLGLMGTVAWLCTATLQPYAGRLADQLHTFKPMLIGIGFVPFAGVIALAFWPRILTATPRSE
jgi:ACS family hexuronate transporter-like MFS transporter